MENYLVEQIKTCKNLCDVAEILFNVGREDLLPTILECLLLEAQEMVDDHCVKQELDTCRHPGGSWQSTSPKQPKNNYGNTT